MTSTSNRYLLQPEIITLEAISDLLYAVGEPRKAVKISACRLDTLMGAANLVESMNTEDIPKNVRKALSKFNSQLLGVVESLPVDWRLAGLPVQEYIDHTYRTDNAAVGEVLSEMFQYTPNLMLEDDGEDDGDDSPPAQIVLSSTLSLDTHWIKVFPQGNTYKVEVITPDDTVTCNSSGDLVPLDDSTAAVFANLKDALHTGIDIIAYLDKEYASGYMEEIPTQAPEDSGGQSDSGSPDDDAEDWMDDGGGGDFDFDDVDVGSDDTGTEDDATADNEEDLGQ